MKEKLKGGKGLTLAIILALIIVVGGGTYAFLQLKLLGTKENVLKAGSLELVLDDTTSDGITLTNAVPISDAKGLETEVYTFTLENKGTAAVDYTIYLDDIPIDEGKTRMADKYVKYSLTKNGGEATTALLTTIGENPNRVLDTGTIAGGTTNTYTLRIWMDKDADNDAMGTVFNAQLRVEASQTGDTKGPTITLGDITTTTDTITIPYTAEDASGVKEYICEYGTTEDLGSTGEATSTECTITGLSSNTTYYYKITAIDNKLNEASKTGNTKTASNSNIVVAYKYNSSSCVTGEESECIETTCYTNSASGSCSKGTIIKYKVNDSTTKYFHVLHDDGATLTMQQRENTVYNTAWYAGSDVNTSGPTTVLTALEAKTSGWSNVNDQTYTMGTTTLYSNAYTGCTVSSSGSALTCSTNTYTLGQRTGKARMITVQEAVSTGCTDTSQSCPNWMNNYLSLSTTFGGTVNDTTGGSNYNQAYWTMSAYSSNIHYAWMVSFHGCMLYYNTNDYHYGARAVVVVNK